MSQEQIKRDVVIQRSLEAVFNTALSVNLVMRRNKLTYKVTTFALKTPQGSQRS